jgi:segregation and condensation protein B
MEHTHDTEVVDVAAPQVLEEPAQASPLKLPHAAPDIAELATKVEALLITAGKPLTIERLGQALGMIALDPAEAAPAVTPPATPDSEAAPAEPAIITRVKRRSKRHAAEGPTPQDRLLAAITHLNAIYSATARSFRIEPMAGGFRLMTLPEFGAVVEALRGGQSSGKLSRAAIETLAIIAYKQPITRGKLEAVRGCSCGEVLKSLTERRLVTVVGRAEELGRPLLYATSKQFLDAFGLSSLKDLPTSAELK